jgi:hypothetical protein
VHGNILQRCGRALLATDCHPHAPVAPPTASPISVPPSKALAFTLAEKNKAIVNDFFMSPQKINGLLKIYCDNLT